MGLQVIYTVKVPSLKGGFWCAEILGRSKKFGLEREWLAAVDKTPNQGKEAGGELTYILDEERLYQIQSEPGKNWFVMVENGEAKTMDKKAALVLVDQWTVAAKKSEEEINQRIARFNSEGGIIDPSNN